MNGLFRTLMTSIKAKFTGLVTKLRLWVSPTYWRTQGIGKVRQFFTKLFDIKPKHKKDYYTIWRWMISKKLAFAVVVIAGVLCAFYIFLMSPVASADDTGGESLRAYKYSSIPLRFYSGKVKILAREGYVAYVGQVDDGACSGQGSLYRQDGSLVYEGAFGNSMYNGTGKLYDSAGNLVYQGEFVDNLYSGTGKEYWENGSLQYQGSYSVGLRWGAGELFSSGGNLVFTGNFQGGQLIYEEFVGKTTAQAGQMYTGNAQVYSTDAEYAVAMPEIEAIYEVDGNVNALDQEWQVSRILVLKGEIVAGGKALTEINELTAWYGQPSYFGMTEVTLGEAMALNLLSEAYPDEIEGVEMKTTETFDGVYDVERYGDTAVYIYMYEAGDLTYTFYAHDSVSTGFFAFAVE